MYRTRIAAIGLVGAAATLLTGCLQSGCEAQGGEEWCAGLKPVTVCTKEGETVRCRTEQECNWQCAYPDSPLLGSKFASKVSLESISIDRAMHMIASIDKHGARRAGLKSEDIGSVLNNKPFTDARLEEFARFHGVSKHVAADKVEKIVSAFNEQRQRTDSVYWQTCIQSGKWATLENHSCEKTFWKGCSPETGATMCFTTEGKSRLND